MAAELRPRVIVMDCAMPGASGLVATREILAAQPETAILMLSMPSEETLVRAAINSGARCYVLKNALDLDLAAAVARVAAGETVLDPALAQPAHSRVSAPRPDPARARGPAAHRNGLSNRNRRAAWPEREHCRRPSRQTS